MEHIHAVLITACGVFQPPPCAQRTRSTLIEVGDPYLYPTATMFPFTSSSKVFSQ